MGFVARDIRSSLLRKPGSLALFVAAAAIFLLYIAVLMYARVGEAHTVTIDNATYTLGASANYSVGQEASNFLVQMINATSVSGLVYMWYPLARQEGMARTLHLNDTVGYGCDGSLKILTAIDYLAGTVTFTNLTSRTRYACPL